MGKPFHFNLLHKLFIGKDNKPTSNWTRITLGTKSKDKWCTLKEHILSLVDSHQYGEFLYLLTHNWVEPTCPQCGNKLKYNFGYKIYCSRKCSRANQHTEEASLNTRRQHRKESDKFITIDINNLSKYDNEYISQLLKDGKYTSYFSSVKTSVDKKYANIRYWLNNRISWSKSWKETIYCIYSNITKQPTCKVCGQPAVFRNFNKGYSKYCSQKCVTQDDDVKNIISLKNIKNGHERGRKVSIIKRQRTREQINNEIQKSKLTRKYIYDDENYVNTKQAQQTNLEKWGHICPLHSPLLKNTYENKLTDHGRQKLSEYRKLLWQDEEYRINNLILMRAGQSNMSEESRQSKEKGYLKWWNNLSEKEKQKHNYNVSKGVSAWHKTLTPEQKQLKQDKEYITKKKNNSFNKSKPEDRLAEYIWKYFPDMIRQYKSPQYPTSCDFYIPCIDTYIEYQGSWTHGKHPYVENTDDDNILKKWIEKETEFYKNAIHVWTVSDVKKRKIAKENNLKFYELWNEKDAMKFIDKLYEEYRNNCK